MLAITKAASPKIKKHLKPHGTSGFRHYGANWHCIKDGMNIDKRIAYLIQANENEENENSLKALDIRGFREFLILDASPVNDRFRGNRPRFSYEILPTGANKKTAV